MWHKRPVPCHNKKGSVVCHGKRDRQLSLEKGAHICHSKKNLLWQKKPGNFHWQMGMLHIVCKLKNTMLSFQGKMSLLPDMGNLEIICAHRFMKHGQHV